MTPAELAHIRGSTCPVRLRRKYAEGERARRGGGLMWAAPLREWSTSTAWSPMAVAGGSYGPQA